MKQASNQAAVDALARVTDSMLLQLPADELLDQAYAAVDPIAFEGIALRAPASLKLSGQAAAPALVVISQPAIRANQAPPATNAVFFANKLGTSEHWVAPLFPLDPTKLPPLPDQHNQPSAASGPVESTLVRRVDLKTAGVMPWQAGDYALRVISFYLRSNTVTVRLNDGVAAAHVSVPHEPAQEVQLTAPGSAPELTGHGIALGLPVTIAAGVHSMPVQGLLRLPARSPTAGASETVYLVMTRRGILTPAVYRVPVKLAPAASGGVEARFSTDLVQLAGGAIAPERYAVYVVADRYTAGPYLLKVD